MKSMTLLRALGGAEDRYLLECRTEVRRRPGRGLGALAALAACGCLAAGLYLGWGYWSAGQELGVEDLPPSRPPVSAAVTAPELALNPLSAGPEESGGVYALYNLSPGDFVPMTEEELLDLFGAELPVEELLPGFTAQPGEETPGIYRREGGEVYFAVHTFSFASPEGGTLSVALAQAPQMVSSLSGGQTLAFTEVNGRALAVFSQGEGTLWTQFYQGGLCWTLLGENLGEETFARALAGLVEAGDTAGRHTWRGTVSTLGVSYVQEGGVETFDHAYMTVELEGAPWPFVMVDLTEEEAAAFARGDGVSLTFAGEPATSFRLWADQVEAITPLT